MWDAAQIALIQRLADGEAHSGQALATELGISRAAVWKRIQGLQRVGLPISARSGLGYRVPQPLELLDAERILAALDADARATVQRLDVAISLASTSDALAQAEGPLPGRVLACFAEHQSAGRGRQGRVWLSPFGCNLSLSIAWCFDLPLHRLAGLSLALGVALAERLTRLGIDGIALKWPNDLLRGGGKLGGILIETKGEAQGPVRVVIGVGVNLRMPLDQSPLPDQVWADLADVRPAPGRNLFAAEVFAALVDACREFQLRGFEPFREGWERYDATRGRMVRILHAEGALEGRAEGIDPSGGLVIAHGSGRRVFHAGEVSLRMTDT
jgi:BirA family biotin operon repressor/biotin-[acetyl-CoA-carboxylase] ligase